MYLNKVFLYGNLTRDPELRALPSGGSVANLSMATNRSFTNKEGQKSEQVEFHSLVAFGKVADVMGQYLKKGRPVFIEGRLQTRSWEAEGKKQYKTEIVVDQFQFGPQSSSDVVHDEPQPREPKADGPVPEAPANSIASSIEYPDDEINPEDIPF